MYRACTLRALRLGVDLEDAAALARVVDEARVELRPAESREGKAQVWLDGEDVSAQVRTREVTQAIHFLANCPEVRERLVKQQRALGDGFPAGVVAEGRDLGSVVFPHADLKVYLDASAAERARRRSADLGEEAPDVETLQREIEDRDTRDTKRLVGPLVRVDDAVYVDSSRLTIPEVVERLEGLALAV